MLRIVEASMTKTLDSTFFIMYLEYILLDLLCLMIKKKKHLTNSLALVCNKGSL